MDRLLLLAALHLVTPISRISMSTNSARVIDALGISGSSFQPYCQNRVTEVIGLREDILTRCAVLELVTSVLSGLNLSDLGRGAMSAWATWV